MARISSLGIHPSSRIIGCCEATRVDVVLIDRPEVLGIVRDGHRLRRHPADLFGPWGVEADVVVLARVLHDWNDGSAVEMTLVESSV